MALSGEKFVISEIQGFRQQRGAASLSSHIFIFIFIYLYQGTAINKEQESEQSSRVPPWCCWHADSLPEMEEEDAFSHFGAFLSPIPAFPICFHCFLGFDKVFAIMDGIVFHPPPLLLPLKGSRGRQTWKLNLRTILAMPKHFKLTQPTNKFDKALRFSFLENFVRGVLQPVV